MQGDPETVNESVAKKGKPTYATIIICLSILAFLIFGFLFYKLYFQKKPAEKVAEEPQITQVAERGEVGYQEPTTVVKIGSEKVNAGNFVKVEAGKIYFESGQETKQFPLTEEVVLTCTNQNLEGAVELDYDQVGVVYTMPPSEVATKIPSSEFIVVFAEYVEGVLTAHTVAMAASSCPSE